MQSESFQIELAGREWARQFYTAVVKSFAKTVTEPVTNSDTSYKRKLAISHASGLVEKALLVPKGQQFDLSIIKEELKNKSLKRTIEIHLYTAKGHNHQPRTCEIVDCAEGMTPEELKAAFKEFASDKSDVSKGKPGRSLFGRGVSDVLLGHKGGVTFPQFRGHPVKPQPSLLRTRPGSHSRGSSDDAADYRTPRCTRRCPVSRLHGSHSADGTRARA